MGPGQSQPSVDLGAQVRRVRREMHEAQYGIPGPINQARPLADPQNQTAASLLSLHNTARTVFGCITGVTAVANVYRVQFEKAKQPTICVYGARTTCAVSGPRDLTTLQAGTVVLCVLHDQIPYGIITGVLPQPNTQAATANASVLFGSSRARVDELHKRPLRMPRNGTVVDMLAGRPFDATMAGEVGWITETGVRIFLDEWLATIGVDEMCGLTAFYHDQLLRLAAYNYQHWTACLERESMNDQNECLDWTGWATFPWEQFGDFSPGGHPLTVKTAKEWQLDTPWYGKVEPADDWAMPWHRIREFNGYLGQGGYKSVQAAPPNQIQATYASNTETPAPVYPGLFNAAVTLDGRMLLQSAKGFSVAKRTAIASPARRRRPEQPGTLGDHPGNYKFSGLSGTGETPAITGDMRIEAAQKNLSRAASILDAHAYFFNYAAHHPFFYHAQDYHLPEESEQRAFDGKSCEIPTFVELADQMYLDTEKFKHSVPIDHRYGSSDYYTLGCGYDLLDDGGVVHYGGCGEEIRMVGGSIMISCPGDIWLKAGRNVVQWAGWDAITRALNCADTTVSQGDIRQKAERNYQILAGNSGDGGVLIESRASAPIYNFEQPGEGVQSSGIMFKAKNSHVTAWGSGVYLRTGGGDVQGGPIQLDAARGAHDIITTSGNFLSYLRENRMHYFGSDSESRASSFDVRRANHFSQGSTVLCSTTLINGQIIAAGNAVIKGSVLVASGHIATEQAQTNVFVAPLTEPGLTSVYQAVSEAEEAATQTIPRGGVAYHTSLTETIYAEGRPGNDATIERVGVSLRRMSDYRTHDFVLYEDRWQQLARLSEKDGDPWAEAPVVYRGLPTYPFPGREKFEETVYLQQNLRLFDAENGHSVDRGEQPSLSPGYKEPVISKPVAVKLDKYTVIRGF